MEFYICLIFYQCDAGLQCYLILTKLCHIMHHQQYKVSLNIMHTNMQYSCYGIFKADLAYTIKRLSYHHKSRLNPRVLLKKID